MTTRNPYEDTSVSAEKSMGEIRTALLDLGAKRISFEEEHAPDVCRVRGMIPSSDHEGRAPFPVLFEVFPLPPGPAGPRGGKGIDSEQRRRQAWRALAWWISTMAKAAQFGIMSPEQAFLAFVEQEDGRTIGEVAIPMLHAGLRQIEAPK